MATACPPLSLPSTSLLHRSPRARPARRPLPTVRCSAVGEAVTEVASVGTAEEPLLVSAIRGRKVERPPVWLMRQAGRRDIIGAISWGLLCCFLIISSYMMLYFRHLWLSAAIISVGILLPAGLYIFRQRKLAKKRERRLLLPLSM